MSVPVYPEYQSTLTSMIQDANASSSSLYPSLAPSRTLRGSLHPGQGGGAGVDGGGGSYDNRLAGFVLIVVVALCLMALFLFVILPRLCHPNDAHSPVAFAARVKRRCQTIQDWLILQQVMDCGQDAPEQHKGSLKHTQQQARVTQTLPTIKTTTTSTDPRDATTADPTLTTTLTTSPDSDVEMGVHVDTQDEPDDHDDNDAADVDQEEYRIHSCQICMEEFQVDDWVAWSTACTHVYHYNCIQEWLLHHTACPSCRIVMLPVDDHNWNHILHDHPNDDHDDSRPNDDHDDIHRQHQHQDDDDSDNATATSRSTVVNDIPTMTNDNNNLVENPTTTATTAIATSPATNTASTSTTPSCIMTLMELKRAQDASTFFCRYRGLVRIEEDEETTGSILPVVDGGASLSPPAPSLRTTASTTTTTPTTPAAGIMRHTHDAHSSCLPSTTVKSSSSSLMSFMNKNSTRIRNHGKTNTNSTDKTNTHAVFMMEPPILDNLVIGSTRATTVHEHLLRVRFQNIEKQVLRDVAEAWKNKGHRMR